MADHPAPSTETFDFETAMVAQAFPPATLKSDEKPESQTRRAGHKDPVTAKRKPTPRLSLREAFKHYYELLPSNMLAEAVY